jgi:formamidopyrimidine-DNA glycosylase
MPELPELEIARRQLDRWTSGRALTGVRLLDRAVVRRALSTRPSDAVDDPEGALAPLLDRTPEPARRHGKRVALILGDRALCAHFGMTGFLARRPASEPAPPLARLGLAWSDDHVVWLVDGRRFGCVQVVSAAAVDGVLAEGQGPDALTTPPTASSLRAALKGRKPVKPALMEQERLAGLGNIHAAEACFRAKIHPARACSALTDPELAALASAISAQLAFAIAEADTDGDVAYVNLGGPNPFAVYGRDGEPCPACGTKVRSEEQAGRTTFWCPSCQPET